MTVIANEAKKMDGVVKTYLEMYEDYIRGYKEYKMEKAIIGAKALDVAQSFGEVGTETAY